MAMKLVTYGGRIFMPSIQRFFDWSAILRYVFPAYLRHSSTKARPGSVPLSTASKLRPSCRNHSTVSLGPRALECQAQDDQGMLDVVWDNGHRVQYPYVWLRDNCQCVKCFHNPSQARLLLMRDLDVNIRPDHIQIDNANNRVLVTWLDGHVSPYPFEWLEKRAFTDRCQEKHEGWFGRTPQTWGNEMEGKIPTASFNQILEDDHALYDWITKMEEVGIFLLTGAPQEVGQLKKIGDRIALLRVTNYGPNFTVKAKQGASNLAYTAATLGLHTDLPYYDYVPGVQMLHCIKQASMKGGENQFADGFHAAKQIERDHPDDFHVLTTVPVDNVDMGTDYYKFHKMQRRPTVTKDQFGIFHQISYNNQSRDSFLSVPLDMVQPLYRALRRFEDTLNDPANVVHLKTSPGDIICFHNFRILHGRNSYTVTSANERHLEGGYLDWDELHSRRRVLKAELGFED